MPDNPHAETRYIIPVTRETYSEIRRILIASGQGGSFESHEGREAIDMSNIILQERPRRPWPPSAR